MLEHAVGINAKAGFALPLGREMRPDVHAGGVPPEEERLVRLLRIRHETQRLFGELIVHRFHPFFRQRAGALDLLGAIRVGPAMDHAAGVVFLDQRRVLEIVGVLRFLLGIQVIERSEKLAEAVRGGQVFVAVAEMVLAELAGHVALRLEQFGNRHIARLQTFLRARQTDLEHAGAEARSGR